MKYIDYQEQEKQGTFRFPIAYYRCSPLSPRYHMQLHWHTHYEILRIVSGTFHLTLGDELRTLEAGDCVFITGGVLHGGNPYDCVYECIVFDLQQLLRESLAETRIVHAILTQKIMIMPYLTDYSPEILPLIENICSALSGRLEGYELAAQGYFYLLISLLISQRFYEKSAYDTVSSDHLASLKNVLSYIASNYSDHITLDTLARIAGMNPKYFCRYFKNITERTPIDYLNYYRIECACELLSTKDISVKEAAISCGFNDESYFIKTFQKYKGTTPKRFLKAEFS